MKKALTVQLLVSCALTLTSVGQAARNSKRPPDIPNLDYSRVDKTPPPYCGSALVSTATITGSDAYRRLRAITEALMTAQLAAENLKNAGNGTKSNSDPADVFSNLFEAEQKTIDGLHCAAQIMYRFGQQPANKKDSLITLTLTIGFNKEAKAIELLRDSQKERFGRQTEPTKAQVIADSIKLQKITDLQRDAGSSIFEATGLAAALSADISDQKAAKIENTLLSCPQVEELTDLLRPVAAVQETIYNNSAQAILDEINQFACKP